MSGDMVCFNHAIVPQFEWERSDAYTDAYARNGTRHDTRNVRQTSTMVVSVFAALGTGMLAICSIQADRTRFKPSLHQIPTAASSHENPSASKTNTWCCLVASFLPSFHSCYHRE